METIIDIVGLYPFENTMGKNWTAMEIYWSAGDIGDMIDDHFIQDGMTELFEKAERIDPTDRSYKAEIEQFNKPHPSRFRQDVYILPVDAPREDHNGAPL